MTATPRFDAARVLVWAVVVAVVATAIGAAWLLPRRDEPGTPPRAGTPSAPVVADGEWEDDPAPPPPPTTGLFESPVGTWLDAPAVERSGLALRTSELLGRWLVVDFVFSSCGGTCPRLQTAMQHLQAATKADPDLRLVSISVDPARDTPEALQRWADALGADRSRWLFLRLEEPEVRRVLGKDGLKIPTADELIAHSNLFLLVDPEGRVRGRYEPLEHENWMQVLLADLAKVRAGAPPR